MTRQNWRLPQRITNCPATAGTKAATSAILFPSVVTAPAFISRLASVFEGAISLLTRISAKEGIFSVKPILISLTSSGASCR